MGNREIRMTEDGQGVLRRLEERLGIYDHIFLVPGRDGAVSARVQDILRAGAGMAGERKFLLLSAAPLGDIPGFTREQVTGEEEGLLLRLYHMYEFSDHFSVIMEESGHGGLYHLVDTGLLSVGEAAQALFS